MKTKIRLLLCGLALRAPAAAAVLAADVTSGATGPVLVLENERAAAAPQVLPVTPPPAPWPPTPPAPAVELSADALGMFTTRVQPILMNTCASCHASGKGGAFTLTRAYDGGAAARRATQQNVT